MVTTCFVSGWDMPEGYRPVAPAPSGAPRVRVRVPKMSRPSKGEVNRAGERLRAWWTDEDETSTTCARIKKTHGNYFGVGTTSPYLAGTR